MRRSNVRQRALKAGYRSGIEQDISEQLKKKKIEAEYEPFKIPYIMPESHHTYTPDFVLGNGIVLESKGRFLHSDRKKHCLIQDQYPNLDLRFVFSNSRSRLRKGSKTTYAIWCEKNGFLYADKVVPVNWLKEKTNKKSLTIISKITMGVIHV